MHPLVRTKMLFECVVVVKLNDALIILIFLLFCVLSVLFINVMLVFCVCSLPVKSYEPEMIAILELSRLKNCKMFLKNVHIVLWLLL